MASKRSYTFSFPRFVEFEKRLESYKNAVAVKYFNFRAIRLARAGFFYSGCWDECVCFYCGRRLCSWEERDDPWVEHAKWSPKCPFLLISKGSEFVDEVRKVYKVRKTKIDTDCVNNTDEVALQCLICLTNEKKLVFLPCKHCCVCAICGPRMKTCVVCREPVLSTMCIYLS